MSSLACAMQPRSKKILLGEKRRSELGEPGERGGGQQGSQECRTKGVGKIQRKSVSSGAVGSSHVARRRCPSVQPPALLHITRAWAEGMGCRRPAETPSPAMSGEEYCPGVLGLTASRRALRLAHA